MDSSEASMMSTEEPVQVSYNKSGNSFDVSDHPSGSKCAFIVSRGELDKFKSKIQELVTNHSSNTTLNELRANNKGDIKNKLQSLSATVTEGLQILEDDKYDGLNVLDAKYQEYLKSLDSFKQVYTSYRENNLESYVLESPIMGRFVDSSENADNTNNKASLPMHDELRAINLLEGKVMINYKKNPADEGADAFVNIHDVCTQSNQVFRLSSQNQSGGAKTHGKMRSRRHNRFNLSETSSDHGVCD